MKPRHTVLLAHPGTQHAPALARELARREWLGAYWTGLAFAEESWSARLARLVGAWPGLRRLPQRIVSGLNAARLHTTPAIEVRALRRLRSGEDALRVLHERNAAFQRAIPDAALEDCDAVIGFDTSSWLLAERAAAAGRRFWLDRTIGHPAACAPLLERVHRDHPGWAAAPAPRPPDIVAAEAREHELAHAVVVGSQFARQTLLDAGVPAARIRVNHYGVDWTRFAGEPRPLASRPLRFVFVGSIQARKGVPYLLEAWRHAALRDAELWLVGALGVDRALVPDLPGLRVVGPVPRERMPSLLAAADVFVLPSLLEGFSLALVEALAAGLYLIATPNTGAADALADSTHGRLVAPANVDALTAALRETAARPPDNAAIRRTAASLEERFNWNAYGDRWAKLLDEA